MRAKSGRAMSSDVKIGKLPPIWIFCRSDLRGSESIRVRDFAASRRLES
jgi:hypothetical protein